MRILAGEAKGRPLRTPDGRATRPTAARVRGAIFDRLASWIEGRRVLDLFCGGGGLGLEALSRGASEAAFVESSRPAFDALRANLLNAGFAERSLALHLPVDKALPRMKGRRFDLVLLDPPFEQDLAPLVLASLERLGLLEPDGEIVLVHASRKAPPAAPSGLEAETRRFGDTSVTRYAPLPDEEA